MRAVLIFLLIVQVAAAQTFIFGRQRTATGGGAVSTLNDDLVAYWKLNEASGTRVDEQGANDLTDNNTVTSMTGLISDAAYMISGNSEYLSSADTADLSVANTSWTAALWIQPHVTNVLQYITAKGAAAGSNREWYLQITTGARLRFFYSTNGSSTLVMAQAGTTPPTNSWTMVVCLIDTNSLSQAISINGGEWVTNSIAGFNTTDGTGSFEVGKSWLSSTVYYDGGIDEYGFWRRALTRDEVTELYNSGSGKTCCPFAAP